MDKDSLEKKITTKAYNTGFGAQKHFASYFILTKSPSWIGLLTFAIGLVQLAGFIIGFEKITAIVLMFSGGAIWLMAAQYTDKEIYNTTGKQILNYFDQLHTLYIRTQKATKKEMVEISNELAKIDEEFQKIAISKQVFISDWLAHYSFFMKMDISWLEEARGFGFWRDKIPSSFKIILYLAIPVGALVGWFYS